MPSFAVIALAVSVLTSAVAQSTGTAVHRMRCVVDSVASAANLSNCTSVVIHAFDVPSGETITIAAAPGASVTMAGDIKFLHTNATGPLITFKTTDILFNGQNHIIDGNGPLYWDGQGAPGDSNPFNQGLDPVEGTNGGVAKPHPFVKFKGSGVFADVTILNSPAQAISVGTTGPTTIKSVTVNNAAGNVGDLGHNTDGFDISASDLTLSGCIVNNQDDCVAINSGRALVIESMTCVGSHGISIGSIATNKSVSDVRILRNTIRGGLYGLRIKGPSSCSMQVDAVAVNASVSNVLYESNTVSGITKFGVLITQSYPDDDTTPGTGAPISGVSFLGGRTDVSVDSDAFTVVVNCGACSGIWDFSDLHAAGGKGSMITPDHARIFGGIY